MARSRSSRRRRPSRRPDSREPRARAAERRAARAVGAGAIVDGGRLRYPDDLPITARHDELLAAIGEHQVVIVAGETGSGKSTQLPKLCIEAGRGVDGMIGHTQPRRVAARTIAERVADELGSALGGDVGFAVRFTDTVGDATLVKVMTDGILLAEIQRDRMLRRYDTLIVDEAHERSLNIDFILGYLAQLLPQRPDLKLVVTSATIDTERFARHFARDGQPAPVVEVSGRTYPVEVRYRPFGPDAAGAADDGDDGDDGDVAADAAVGRSSRGDQRDQVQAVLDAVDELAAEGPGDVLVFLSGEREIHDTADALRRRRTPQLEVLPLYARLSAPEQHRIFQPHDGRRIVLATNIAETSLTVPGVRYVVDAGTARISRYSRRLKVQRLPIEPISQASADQRAGRCGRVAPGICIRLYGEDDLAGRPEFTEPEILRTNLASVILQMTAIGLGDVAGFPFVEPPDARAVRDGALLLEELAAIEPDRGDGPRRLTRIGRRLARLPIDPRLGRMILEAERHGCVREVLVIAAALSIQDVRERPVDQRERAAQLHARFRVPGSDLLSIVKLWDHLRQQQRALSGNAFRRMCHDELLHYLRVREWMDLYSQLRRIAGDLGIRPDPRPDPKSVRKSAAGERMRTENGREGADDGGHRVLDDALGDRVHQAVLAGLLSHIGMRDGSGRDYRGARQARFVIAPGSALTRRPPDWVMAAELVETTQLYARRVAAIDPAWAERIGAHLVKRSHGTPRWDAAAGRAVTTEQVTLYGLPLVSDRVVGLDRVDADEARAWFIARALVAGEWRSEHDFVERNAAAIDRWRSLSDRTRGVELVDEETLFEVFDRVLPEDVTSQRRFDRWWRDARHDDPHLLDLTDDLLHELAVEAGDDLAASLQDFPDVWRDGDLELPLTYRYAPGEPLDGVTVHVPLAALNQVSGAGFDWQVPGHRAELVDALVRSLPKPIRRQLIPLADTVDAVLDRLGPPAGRLVDSLARTLSEVRGVQVAGTDFDPAVLPEHLRLHIVVADDEGEVHDVGTDLGVIKARLAGIARASVAAAAPVEERRGIVDWDVGDLPRVVEGTDPRLAVRAYPTLLDVGDSVALRVVTSPALQERALRGGVRRLLLLTAAPGRDRVERLLTDRGRLALAAADLPVAALVDDCVAAAVDRVMDERGRLPWTEAEFRSLQAAVRAEAPRLAGRALAQAATIVVAATAVRDRLAGLRAPALRETVSDANEHLGRLVRPGFVLATGIEALDDLERWVRGLAYRLDHLAGGAERDQQRMAEVRPLEHRYARLVDRLGPGGADVEQSAEIAELGRQLEELRVSVFAQPVGARGPVSPKKVAAALARLGA